MTICDEYKGDRKHNTTKNTIDSSIRQALTLKKPIGSRVDYNLFNYCSNCNLKYSKQILRWPDCRQKVRTKPWHPSKVMQFKRIWEVTSFIIILLIMLSS